jgi:hypothetical protein
MRIIVALLTFLKCFSAEPTITSSLTVTAIQSKSFDYQISASNNPDNFVVSGLPTGLSVDKSGKISGEILDAVGVYPVEIEAKKDATTARGVLKITIKRPMGLSQLPVKPHPGGGGGRTTKHPDGDPLR